MGLPPDSIVALTLSRMQQSLEQRSASGDVSQERSGLLFMGNVHDAVPRRLFLDSRLSPLDKTAWVMIRLYAQQNDGAIFPTYDELQVQLASPHAEKASRETVSRTLLMLRLTGWISLCKRVRDEHGRVRGNIYAQHDEPLSLRDAETFDPGWLNVVESCCSHKNKSIRMMALAALNDILLDPSMRHRHSRLSLIEGRLGAPATPQEMVTQCGAKILSSESELSRESTKNRRILPSSETELSHSSGRNSPSSESELIKKSTSYTGVRNSNCNVRSFTHSVNKKTYVTGNDAGLPEAFLESLNDEDRRMLLEQLAVLPDNLARALATLLREQITLKKLANPIGWMFAMLRRARKGELTLPEAGSHEAGARVTAAVPSKTRSSTVERPQLLPAQRASQEQVRAVINAIRVRGR